MTHPDNHAAYTIDPQLACGAATWGGTHQCSCVYRKTVCDGTNHLCMCGSTWTDEQLCTCSTPREKKEITMATPVGVTITAHQGKFTLEVSMSTEATITPSSVLAVHLERTAKAMAVLLGDTRPSYEDSEPDFG